MIDTGYAWVIPFACFFIQGALFGSYRSYGLLYKVILDKFHVTRSDASWPFSLCMTVIHLTGPISGCLNKYTSVRVITFVGCCLASVGIALCYFASSVVHITLAIGLLQGFGIGLTYIQNSAIINEYFVKYRGTANGISLSGGTIGAFVISSILEYSLREYELKESFITLALIITLTLPVSCLLRQPSRQKARQIEDPSTTSKGTRTETTGASVTNDKSIHDEITINSSSGVSCVNTHTINKPVSSIEPEKKQLDNNSYGNIFTLPDTSNYWSLVPRGYKWSFFHDTSSSNSSLVKTNSLASIFSIGKQSKNTHNLMKESPSTIDSVPNVSLIKYRSNGITFKSNETINSKEYLNASKLPSDPVHSVTFNSTVNLADNFSSPRKFYTHHTICNGQIITKSGNMRCDEEVSSDDSNNSSNDDSSVTSYCSCDESVVNTSQDEQSSVNLISSIKGIIKNPMFILIALTHASYFWSVITFTMVIVDYSLDKGISMNSTVALINSFSIGDLVGRLASGILLDSLHLQLKHISNFAISGIGLCMVVTPAFAKLSYSFQLLAGVNVALGLLSGLINVLLNNLFCLYVGSKHAALAFGLSAFISGILTLGRPSLVGYFRDRSGGSYDGLFITLGIASLITGALWLFEPCIKSRSSTPTPTIEDIIEHKCHIHRRNSSGSCTSNSSTSDTSSCDHNCIHHKSTTSIVTEKTLVSNSDEIACKSSPPPHPSSNSLPLALVSIVSPPHPHPPDPHPRC